MNGKNKKEIKMNNNKDKISYNKKGPVNENT
jgi:hypothetical protein